MNDTKKPDRPELFVGQVLFFVGNQTAWIGRSVEVKKVGRKWAQLSNNIRIDKITLTADGGGYNSPGQCHVSEFEYREKIASIEKWKAIKAQIQSMRSPSAEKIQAIQAILDGALDTPA